MIIAFRFPKLSATTPHTKLKIIKTMKKKMKLMKISFGLPKVHNSFKKYYEKTMKN